MLLKKFKVSFLISNHQNLFQQMVALDLQIEQQLN